MKPLGHASRSGLMTLLCCLGASVAQAAPDYDGIAERLERGDYRGIQGAMVSVGGERVLEAYSRGNDANTRHDIRSATKSITALLVGELIEDRQRSPPAVGLVVPVVVIGEPQHLAP